MILPNTLKKVEQLLRYLRLQGRLRFPLRLNDIRDAVLAAGFLDDIEFIGYEDPKFAPGGRGEIEGFIRFFTWRPSPYEDEKTRAEVYYLATLPAAEQRFVVVKEMCQALWNGHAACRVRSVEQLLALVEALTLPADSRSLLLETEQFSSELSAMVAALEILCPFEARAGFVERHHQGEDVMQEVMRAFGISEGWARVVLLTTYHDAIVRWRQQGRLDIEAAE